MDISFYTRLLNQAQQNSWVGKDAITDTLPNFFEGLSLIANITQKTYQNNIAKGLDSKQAKKTLPAIFGQSKYRWAGHNYNDNSKPNITIISPDTDYHKMADITWDSDTKQSYIDKFNRLPFCLAIVESVNGGIAPIFAINTQSLPNELLSGKKPSKKFNTSYKVMEFPDFIFDGLEVSKDTRDRRFVGCNLNQPRIVYKVIWTNPDVVPYEYEALSKEYLDKVNKLIWEKQRKNIKPISDFEAWLKGEKPLSDKNCYEGFKQLNYIGNTLGGVGKLNTTPEHKNSLYQILQKAHKSNTQALQEASQALNTTPDRVATIYDNFDTKLESKPITIDDFREQFLKNLDYTKWQVIQAPMASGKSHFFTSGFLEKVLILVNSQLARKQFLELATNLLGSDNVTAVQVDGSNIIFNENAKVVIMTQAKLAMVGKQSEAIRRMITKCTCIVFDEFQNGTDNQFLNLLKYNKPVTFLSANSATAMLPDYVREKIDNKNIHSFESPVKPTLDVYIRQTKYRNLDTQYGQSRFVDNYQRAALKRAHSKSRDYFGEIEEKPSKMSPEEYKNRLIKGEKLSHTSYFGEGFSMYLGKKISVEWNVGSSILLNSYKLAQSVGRYRDGVSELHLTLAQSVFGEILENEMEWLVFFADMIDVKKFEGLKNKHKLAIQLSELKRSFNLNYHYIDLVNDNGEVRERKPRQCGSFYVKKSIADSIAKATKQYADDKGQFVDDLPRTPEEIFIKIYEKDWSNIFDCLDKHKNVLTPEVRGENIPLPENENDVRTSFTNNGIAINDVIDFAQNHDLKVTLKNKPKNIKNNNILTSNSFEADVDSKVFIQHIVSGFPSPENEYPETRKVRKTRKSAIQNKSFYEKTRQYLKCYFSRLGIGLPRDGIVNNFHYQHPEMDGKTILKFFKIKDNYLEAPEVEYVDNFDEVWDDYYTPDPEPENFEEIDWEKYICVLSEKFEHNGGRYKVMFRFEPVGYRCHIGSDYVETLIGEYSYNEMASPGYLDKTLKYRKAA